MHPTYNGHVVFYKNLYNNRGYQIRQKMLHPPRPQVQKLEEVVKLSTGQAVLVCEAEAKSFLEDNFNLEAIHEWKKCHLYRIKAEKED